MTLSFSIKAVFVSSVWIHYMRLYWSSLSLQLVARIPCFHYFLNDNLCFFLLKRPFSLLLFFDGPSTFVGNDTAWNFILNDAITGQKILIVVKLRVKCTLAIISFFFTVALWSLSLSLARSLCRCLSLFLSPSLSLSLSFVFFLSLSLYFSGVCVCVCVHAAIMYVRMNVRACMQACECAWEVRCASVGVCRCVCLEIYRETAMLYSIYYDEYIAGTLNQGLMCRILNRGILTDHE